ncbi:MAG: hypothetical protein PHY12_15040, partial [Eubacteriales bacterium]|nr:hypothetical protein [Eubacteriales bacterium]
DNLCMSAGGCFNDMDMLTVGMYGKGNVGLGKVCTFEEYRQQFALWCLFGVPLMMGGDVRSLSAECEALLKNPALLAIDQDEECRPPYLIHKGCITVTNPDPAPGEYPWKDIHDAAYTFIRHLSNNEFALAFFNFAEQDAKIDCLFSDMGLPYPSGVGLELTDVFTGEKLGVKRDAYKADVAAHGCRLFRARLAHCNG